MLFASARGVVVLSFVACLLLLRTLDAQSNPSTRCSNDPTSQGDVTITLSSTTTPGPLSIAIGSCVYGVLTVDLSGVDPGSTVAISIVKTTLAALHVRGPFQGQMSMNITTVKVAAMTLTNLTIGQSTSRVAITGTTVVDTTLIVRACTLSDSAAMILDKVDFPFSPLPLGSRVLVDNVRWRRGATLSMSAVRMMPNTGGAAISFWSVELSEGASHDLSSVTISCSELALGLAACYSADQTAGDGISYDDGSIADSTSFVRARNLFVFMRNVPRVAWYSGSGIRVDLNIATLVGTSSIYVLGTGSSLSATNVNLALVNTSTPGNITLVGGVLDNLIIDGGETAEDRRSWNLATAASWSTNVSLTAVTVTGSVIFRRAVLASSSIIHIQQCTWKAMLQSSGVVSNTRIDFVDVAFLGATVTIGPNNIIAPRTDGACIGFHGLVLAQSASLNIVENILTCNRPAVGVGSCAENPNLRGSGIVFDDHCTISDPDRSVVHIANTTAELWIDGLLDAVRTPRDLPVRFSSVRQSGVSNDIDIANCTSAIVDGTPFRGSEIVLRGCRTLLWVSSQVVGRFVISNYDLEAAKITFDDVRFDQSVTFVNLTLTANTSIEFKRCVWYRVLNPSFSTHRLILVNVSMQASNFRMMDSLLVPGFAGTATVWISNVSLRNYSTHEWLRNTISWYLPLQGSAAKDLLDAAGFLYDETSFTDETSRVVSANATLSTTQSWVISWLSPISIFVSFVQHNSEVAGIFELHNGTVDVNGVQFGGDRVLLGALVDVAFFAKSSARRLLRHSGTMTTFSLVTTTIYQTVSIQNVVAAKNATWVFTQVVFPFEFSMPEASRLALVNVTHETGSTLLMIDAWIAPLVGFFAIAMSNVTFHAGATHTFVRVTITCGDARVNLYRCGDNVKSHGNGVLYDALSLPTLLPADNGAVTTASSPSPVYVVFVNSSILLGDTTYMAWSGSPALRSDITVIQGTFIGRVVHPRGSLLAVGATFSGTMRLNSASVRFVNSAVSASLLFEGATLRRGDVFHAEATIFISVEIRNVVFQKGSSMSMTLCTFEFSQYLLSHRLFFNRTQWIAASLSLRDNRIVPVAGYTGVFFKGCDLRCGAFHVVQDNAVSCDVMPGIVHCGDNIQSRADAVRYDGATTSDASSQVFIVNNTLHTWVDLFALDMPATLAPRIAFHNQQVSGIVRILRSSALFGFKTVFASDVVLSGIEANAHLDGCDFARDVDVNASILVNGSMILVENSFIRTRIRFRQLIVANGSSIRIAKTLVTFNKNPVQGKRVEFDSVDVSNQSSIILDAVKIMPGVDFAVWFQSLTLRDNAKVVIVESTVSCSQPDLGLVHCSYDAAARGSGIGFDNHSATTNVDATSDVWIMNTTITVTMPQDVSLFTGDNIPVTIQLLSNAFTNTVICQRVKSFEASGSTFGSLFVTRFMRLHLIAASVVDRLVLSAPGSTDDLSNSAAVGWSLQLRDSIVNSFVRFTSVRLTTQDVVVFQNLVFPRILHDAILLATPRIELNDLQLVGDDDAVGAIVFRLLSIVPTNAPAILLSNVSREVRISSTASSPSDSPGGAICLMDSHIACFGMPTINVCEALETSGCGFAVVPGNTGDGLSRPASLLLTDSSFVLIANPMTNFSSSSTAVVVSKVEPVSVANSDVKTLVANDTTESAVLWTACGAARRRTVALDPSLYWPFIAQLNTESIRVARHRMPEAVTPRQPPAVIVCAGVVDTQTRSRRVSWSRTVPRGTRTVTHDIPTSVGATSVASATGLSSTSEFSLASMGLTTVDSTTFSRLSTSSSQSLGTATSNANESATTPSGRPDLRLLTDASSPGLSNDATVARGVSSAVVVSGFALGLVSPASATRAVNFQRVTGSVLACEFPIGAAAGVEPLPTNEMQVVVPWPLPSAGLTFGYYAGGVLMCLVWIFLPYIAVAVLVGVARGTPRNSTSSSMVPPRLSHVPC